MSIQQILLTISGGFIFSFLVLTVWGRLVNFMGAIGGYLAALIIPGTMWIINHGINHHLIHQTGGVWIDMAWAVGIGVFVSSKVKGKKIFKAKNTIMAAIIGGLLGGYILMKISMFS